MIPILSFANLQENELIKYYIDDDILTIEISQKPTGQSFERDSCLGESFGLDQSSVLTVKYDGIQI